MNKLIEELVSQASDEVWGSNPYNGGPGFEGYVLDSNKLARLIIGECIIACATDALGKTVSAEEAIKKHFGVE
jgi:hypothetical protein